MRLFCRLTQDFRKGRCISDGGYHHKRHEQGNCSASSELYEQVKSCNYHDVEVLWCLLEQKQREDALHCHQISSEHAIPCTQKACVCSRPDSTNAGN
ncbi:hypothetical protein KP509_04G028800 [Ceratopteris richardii]|uniref:Uncharacterized protein n=1 Tax=Ceratopteris richardii TaxID=49495 RepID=A0A8T2UTU1_CERRI|nr:hypothetical protein KP509_04G028800 [Ceratopteris richardii]